MWMVGLMILVLIVVASIFSAITDGRKQKICEKCSRYEECISSGYQKCLKG